MKIKLLLSACALQALLSGIAFSSIPDGASYYTSRPSDPDAVYFTAENFGITNDGRTDISVPLQAAIDKLKLENNFGIIFIPEGTYTISRTIYIPGAIRLIGYGKKRPLIILKKNSPGFRDPVATDKGKSSYMFWFTSSVVEPGKPVNDAGAGTFYSALTNINLRIDDGNPSAIALRTHFAQHSYVSHCDIRIGNGRAGVFDIGNEMDDVRFYGGDFGIITTKASPGWQFMMLDTYFEGQRKAAIKTQQAGLTIVRMSVKNTPAVVQVDSNYWEKLFMEDCRFENVTGPAISFDNEGNANMQVNLRNISCKNVPEVIRYGRSNTTTEAPAPVFRIRKYSYGLQMKDIDSAAVFKVVCETEKLMEMPAGLTSDIPPLPAMGTWINIRDLGARGDGITDDSRVIQEAIDKYQSIYFPQGSYRISTTLKLRSSTALIGLHPIATQLVLGESTPAFSGFGAPVPMVGTPEGGNNIITGIGISTGEYNYRAVALKWMSGKNSMVEDVKLVGGHGTMVKGPYVPWRGYGSQGSKPAPVPGADPAWDTQYWSLWVTNGGGGIFKNIWTASSYAVSGMYVSNTTTAGKIYAMSVEHHVRNEVRFNRVSGWKVYALQLEEESREGSECQPMEISGCSDMMFAALYMFRVIRVKIPYPYSVRTWDCHNIEFLNVHNYSQIKYTTDNPLYDVNTGTEVRPVELSGLFISGNGEKNYMSGENLKVRKLAGGFEFAEGICRDSKGNIYFCEQRMKRIYKWSVESNSLDLLADYPWEPLSLACDSRDNLLVVCRYNPQPGHIVNGEQEKFSNPPDASGTSFSMWGNSGFATKAFALDPDNADETFSPMNEVSITSLPAIAKAFYPSNRWRDYHDFNRISVARNENCFVAPDGMTIIPVCYDLARACGLSEAIPGRPFYASDEYDKRTVRMNVDERGYLSDLKYFAEKGEFSLTTGAEGKVYIADGEIYIYNEDGTGGGTIKVPERPTGIIFGGRDRQTLFFTGKTGFYSVSSEGTDY